jgi:DNA-binding MarR family transcriptional regulator
MGQPTPPGDNVPLYEGLSPEWNDIVGAIPENMRAELAPRLKERLDAYEPLKQWENLHNAGVTPDQADTALNLYKIIDSNPQQVYETIGRHLGLTPQQAQDVVEELEDADQNDPRVARLQQQVDTLTQIALTQNQQTRQEKLAAEQDASLNAEIEGIKKKYGDDIPEDEILMRMMHKDMTAEQAYQEYSARVSDIRSRRPSPMILGGGGNVPVRKIDPLKLDSAGRKTLVAQMLDHANAERLAP